MDLRPQRFTERIEGLGAIDSLAERLADAYHGAVGPGPLRDALSGTPLGHPAHPPLTDLVIGAWTAAGFLDLLGGRGSRAAADRLIALGVLGAAPTALTGLNDFSDLAGADRRVGMVHGLGNVGVLGLFVWSWLARKRGRRLRGVLLAMLGNGIALGTAYLGGHLSFGRGVGVDQTAFEQPPGRWTAVMDADDLPEGSPTVATSGSVRLVLYRRGERILALSNRCSHLGGPLNRGSVDGELNVTCPWHGSMFSLEDGSVVRGPARGPQPVYEARVNGGRIEVRPRPASA